MERKWLALTPGDSLPLRLGAVVRPEPPLGPIPEKYTGVLWATNLGDAAVQRSDLKHDSAPKLGGVPTKKAVRDAVSEAAHKAWMEAWMDFMPVSGGSEPALTEARVKELMETIYNATMPRFVVDPGKKCDAMRKRVHAPDESPDYML